jgi:hypothetical protein
MLRNGAGSTTRVRPVTALGSGIGAKCISTTSGAPFEMIVIDVAGFFPWSDQGNRYLLIAMDYFTLWSEA